MDTFYELIISNAVFAAVMAVFVTGVACVYRRPAVVHVLWLLVLLKLLTPPLVQLPFVSFVPHAHHDTRSDFLRPDEAPVQEAIVGQSEASPPATEPSGGDVTNDAEGHFSAQGNDDWTRETGSSLSMRAWRWLSEHILWALTVIWVVGSMIWFAVAAARIRRLARLVRRAPLAPSAVRQRAAKIARQLGLQRCPQIRTVTGQVPPLLWSFGPKTTILLPSDLVGEWCDDEMTGLLTHELAHYRRRDHWVRWLEVLTLGIYWWHPVAWWARRGLQQAEEQCCDAWVAWTYPDSTKGYAETLLETVDFLAGRREKAAQLASGMMNARPLRRRLEMILHDRACPCLSGRARVALLAAAALLLPLSTQALWSAPKDARPATDNSSKQPSALALDAAQHETGHADKSKPQPSHTTPVANDGVQPQSKDHRIDFSQITFGAWDRAIQRATQHRALQVGSGQFTLMRILLDGVEPRDDIESSWGDAADAKKDRARLPAPSFDPPPLPPKVNGVELFLPTMLDRMQDMVTGGSADRSRKVVTNDPSEIQLASVKLVGLKQLAGGGMYRELQNGEFVLVEHINSTRRKDGCDPVSLGSYSHGQATISVKVPPRGQLGIAGDVVLLRQPKERLGRIVAEMQFATDERLTVKSLRLGPLVVGGPYGWSYDFDSDCVCRTDLLPSGTYRILLPDFDTVKSRWTVTVKPGQTTRVKFTARSHKLVEKSAEETIPLMTSAPK